MTNNGIILTRSPFYITESGSAEFTSTIEIRIWNGRDTDVPTDATYTLSKRVNTVNDTTARFEVSKIIADYPIVRGSAYDDYLTDHQKDAVFVNIKSTGGVTDRDDLYLAINGYNSYSEGMGSTTAMGTDGTYLSRTRQKYVPNDTPYSAFIKFPIYLGQGTGFVEYMGTYVLSGISEQDESEKLINYGAYSRDILLPQDATYHKIQRADSTTEYFYINYVDCNGITPTEMVFQNSYGVMEQYWLFGDYTTKTTVKKKEEKFFTAYNFTGEHDYDTAEHQYKLNNITANDIIKINTGYIPEDENVMIEDIINSPAIWLIIDDELIPVNMKTSNIKFKTDRLDGLIDYTFEFEVANNVVNNVY